ncbi:ABC transporter substrate-binding protein [Micromonospora avicenniae]|uniref:Polar amino acid transport system substrate-binding protein n=1 Tax=Micromonospora avicenniae TaxID=1198245 RepID=A0A1N6SBL8_9ACTN|nr:ABC transporter substrate-binding protein [Micromonospora avicenniae]SIQ38535.1 polar amino acid transport system substrate-binding protein [Micromonospora avicenniae]
MFNITGGRRAVLGAAGAAALLLSLAACGEEEPSDSAGAGPSVSASADTSLADKVPAAIKADGKIVVGTDSTYAPAEYLDNDGKTVIGFDVELFRAVAQKLGLEAEFVSAPFGDIITGVNSGKYEVGVSSFTINDERKTQANMVSYFQVGTQWVTKTGNPAGVALDNACGKKIAVQKDTVQVEDIQKRSKACTDAGKPAITVEQFPGQDAATAAVVSGKDDAMLADYPVGVFAVTQSNGALELLDKQYEAAPYGYVVAKDQAEFAEAVREATKALITDGSYKTVLDKWKVADGAITDPAINP